VKRAGLGLVGLGLALSCGGDPVPQPSVRTTVKWVFDSYPNLGIPEGDNCTDLGIDTVQVDLVGPQTLSLADRCSVRQVVFMDLVPGTYTATLSPLDVDGNVLVKAPPALAVTATDQSSDVTVNVPWDNWTQAYKGAFYFRITWGGVDCAAAHPPVVTQVVTLSQGGTATALKTDTGHKLDGSDPEPCRTTNQYVAMLPFGPATISILGKDQGGVVQYKKQFETFAGAGPTNPTIVYDVPGPPDAMPPDAGVDAAVDASM
jgi:hypothetical protein